jgi:hypothetical protein
MSRPIILAGTGKPSTNRIVARRLSQNQGLRVPSTSRAEDILPGAVQPTHDLLDLRQGGALLAVHETEKRGRGDTKFFREILEGILSATGSEKGRKALIEDGESAHPDNSGRDTIPYAELFVLNVPYKER